MFAAALDVFAGNAQLDAYHVVKEKYLNAIIDHRRDIEAVELQPRLEPAECFHPFVISAEGDKLRACPTCGHEERLPWANWWSRTLQLGDRGVPGKKRFILPIETAKEVA